MRGCMKRFLLAILITLIHAGAVQADDQAIGTVVSTTGTVSAKKGEETRTLSANSSVFEGDTVLVGLDSFVQIVLNDKSAINLLSGTEYTFNTFKYAAGASDNLYSSTLAVGGFRLLAGNIASGNPDQYEVNTPVATIGIRGTTIDAMTGPGANGTPESDVKVIYGSIKVKNASGTQDAQSGMTVEVTKNQAPKIVTGTPYLFRGRTFVGPGESICPAK